MMRVPKPVAVCILQHADLQTKGALTRTCRVFRCLVPTGTRLRALQTAQEHEPSGLCACVVCYSPTPHTLGECALYPVRDGAHWTLRGIRRAHPKSKRRRTETK